MNVVELHVIPKTETIHVGKHRITLTFQPDQPLEHRWHWSLKLIQTQDFTGVAPDYETCKQNALEYLAIVEY